MMKSLFIFVYLFLALAEGFGINDCPSNLPKDGNFVYHGQMCYRYVLDNKKPFWAARKDCRETGGDLVVIKNKHLNDLITRDLYEFRKVESDVWIGLSDATKEGRFLWADRTQASDFFTNWGDQQGPGHEGHEDFEGISIPTNQDCVAISSSGVWKDHRCEPNEFFKPRIFRLPYVCQYKPKRVGPTLSTQATTIKITGQGQGQPSTQAPTTRIPSTQAPTTRIPSTQAPTTLTPSTQAPTTVTPSTQAPTTLTPSSQAPTTLTPSTQSPTTLTPSTQAPTTLTQSTQAPTTLTPSTQASTTLTPSTQARTKLTPSTQTPTTLIPSTHTPTTRTPSTQAQTTRKPFTSTDSIEASQAQTTSKQTSLFQSTPEHAPRSTTQAPTTPPPTCPPFVCLLDCGMDGYILDAMGCSLCECDK